MSQVGLGKPQLNLLFIYTLWMILWISNAVVQMHMVTHLVNWFACLLTAFEWATRNDEACHFFQSKDTCRVPQDHVPNLSRCYLEGTQCGWMQLQVWRVQHPRKREKGAVKLFKLQWFGCTWGHLDFVLSLKEPCRDNMGTYSSRKQWLKTAM